MTREPTAVAPGDSRADVTIDVDGLTFAYPDGTPALQDVSLSIRRDERVALLGPNGAGKTTLVLHMNGIHLPRRGTITVGGTPLDDASVMDIRRMVGVVFQDPDDQLFMPTVGEDVAFGPRNLGLTGEALEQRVTDALEAVDVVDLVDRPPNHLSFGQKRRVAIAGVLAMHPEIVVFDEPTSNLDPASRRELTTLLLGLPVTQLIVTHDLPFALELCERSLIMDRGRIVADGPTRTLLADSELLSAHRLEMPFGFALQPVEPSSG